MGHTTTLLVWLQLWHPIDVSLLGVQPVPQLACQVDFPQSLGLKRFAIVDIMPC